MLDTIAELLGGIGLFLIGMSLLTDSIKDLAGESLRLWLARFTGSIYKALLSGIGFTLVLQSSTATTLATIGFVSAGVLSFSQSIGLIIGANIGTTSTGWMVALLGVKFSITNFALPLIAFGAILKLLARGQFALIGLGIAGFGLLFFGIDLLQMSMSGLADQLDLSIFDTRGIWDQLLLVLIGLVMTILLQSSSAAITVTLAALATQTIQLDQALLLVIGQNIGTVATAVLASIGSNIAAQRTAAVHVIFNIVSAVLAFVFLLPLFKTLQMNWGWFANLAPVFIVALFHTLFSLLGSAFFIPLHSAFESFLIRVIPERQQKLVDGLDEVSLNVPALAIQNAQQVLYLHLYDQLIVIKNAIEFSSFVNKHQLQEFDQLLQQLQRYLKNINLPENPSDRENLVNVTRMVVYAHVFRSDIEQIKFSQALRNYPKIYQLGLDYIAILNRYVSDIFNERDYSKCIGFYQELEALKKWTDLHRDELRTEMLELAEAQQSTAATNVELLAAQRWLERLIAHTKRLAKVLVDQHHQDFS